MRLSASTSRLLVTLVFLLSAVAGIETGHYRYADLETAARTVYAIPLAQHGFSQQGFVLYFLITESLVAAAFAFTGLFIALRGPKTPMAVFGAVAMMLYGVTIPPPMHALVVNAPDLAPWLLIERSLGFGLFIVFLYVFPDGRFTTWTIRALSAIVLGWTLLWPLVPATNPYRFAHPWPFLAIAALFASAVLVQLYWFYRVRTALERQQTKWVVYAVAASVVGDFVTHLPWQVFNLQRGPDLIVLLVHQPFFVAFQIVVPLAIGFSVLYYHLWDIDFIVSRTVLYAMVTTAAAVIWEAVNLTAVKLIEKAMGPQSSAFAGGTATVVTGFLLKPMYERFKKSVDKRLTPETLDLSDEFPEFEPDVRGRLTVAARRHRPGGARSGPLRGLGQRGVSLPRRKARLERGPRSGGCGDPGRHPRRGLARGAARGQSLPARRGGRCPGLRSARRSARQVPGLARRAGPGPARGGEGLLAAGDRRARRAGAQSRDGDLSLAGAHSGPGTGLKAFV